MGLKDVQKSYFAAFPDGRKVVVRPIEELMRTSAAIDECVVYCPNEASLVAVVSPSAEPADEEAIHDHLARCNAALDPDERISAVVIAEERFSIENDLLTSQFKPQRRRIFDLYRSRILDSHRGVHVRSH